MRQVLQIFRKDVRRLWIEILITLSLVVFMALIKWNAINPGRQLSGEYQAAAVITVLLSWWFLTARLIQDEALVGNRQFWLTRPYEWNKLFASKLLFIFLFVCLPLALTSATLLHFAGYRGTTYLPGMLTGVLLTLLILVLPVVAAATLTRSFVQWVLVVLAFLALFMALAFLSDYIQLSNLSSVEGTADLLEIAFFSAFSILAVVLQFARRSTRVSWAAFSLGVVLVPIIMVATPYRSLVKAEYPEAGLPRSASFQIEPATAETHDLNFYPEARYAGVRIPIRVSGIAANKVFTIDGAMLSIRLPGGSTWDSDWQAASQNIFPEDHSFAVEVRVRNAVFQRVKSTTARVVLHLATTELIDSNLHTVIADRNFDVPGVGKCWLELEAGNFSCRAVPTDFKYLYVVADSGNNTCRTIEDNDPIAAGSYARDLERVGEFEPLSAIEIHRFSLWSPYRRSDTHAQAKVCRGTRLTFSTPQQSARSQYSIDLGTVQIREYVPIVNIQTVETR